MKSLKQNNKGISLREIIVTVSIIAIVVVPLISGFFTAMEINSDSRRIQNATYIAQDVMEIVKAKDIESLVQYSVDTYGINAIVENNIIINNILIIHQRLALLLYSANNSTTNLFSSILSSPLNYKIYY